MVDRLPRMLGADTEVACLDGRTLRYVNLDYAASAPVMEDVSDAVEAFVPWYSSVHRGTGVQVAGRDRGVRGARGDVARFVGARPDDTSCSCATRPRRSTCSPRRCRPAREC